MSERDTSKAPCPSTKSYEFLESSEEIREITIECNILSYSVYPMKTMFDRLHDWYYGIQDSDLIEVPPPSLSHSLSLPLPFSRSFSHTHTNTHTHTYTHTHTHSLTHSLAHSLYLSHTHTCSCCTVCMPSSAPVSWCVSWGRQAQGKPHFSTSSQVSPSFSLSIYLIFVFPSLEPPSPTPLSSSSSLFFLLPRPSGWCVDGRHQVQRPSSPPAPDAVGNELHTPGRHPHVCPHTPRVAHVHG